MNSYLIQFRNKNNTTEETEKIQIDSSINLDALTAILNSLRGKESAYFFYFKNQRITTSLSDVATKNNLNFEEAMLLEYIDEIDFKADYVKECSNTVTQLSYFNGKIYYLEFSGDVLDFETNEKVASGRNGIFSGFSYDNFNVYDNFGTENILKTFEDRIECCSSFDQSIVVATDKKVYLIDLNGCTEICEHSSFIRSIKINENYISWLENYNTIVVFDIKSGEFSRFPQEYSLVNISLSGSKIFITTANNKILILYLSTLKENEIQARLSNFVISFGSNIIYTTQNEIISCSLDTSIILEKHFHKVVGQINAIEIDGKKIYVANDNNISVFIKSTLGI